jgi:outer membrane protein assembly factor BamB
MKRPALCLGLLAGVAAAGFAARVAWGVCTTDPSRDQSLGAIDLGSTSMSPPTNHPTLGRSVVVANTTLYILDTHTMAKVAGCTAGIALGGKVSNSPTPVNLDDGTWAAFAASEDGYLYKIDPTNCTKKWQVSMKQSDCPGVRLVASPVVHLRRLASDNFKGKYSTDVVYVATRYGDTCSGVKATRNKVIAVRATDGTVLWSFSGDSGHPMDFVSQAGFLDLENDKLYVGSESNVDTQDSVWAIDVIEGTRAWSAAVGGLQVMPVMVDDRLYLATSAGDVKAISKDDGAEQWVVSVGSAVLHTVYVERRDPYKKILGVVDGNGFVNLIRDNDESGSLEWTKQPSGGEATSRVAIDSNAGKLYVGAVDGKLYQMSLVDGSTETSRTIETGSPPLPTVGDPSFVFEDVYDGGSALDDVRLVVGSSAGMVSKFCAPWSTTAPPPPGRGSHRSVRGCNIDADCVTGTDVCWVWKCVDRVCTQLPTAVPDGGAQPTCVDGYQYSYNDKCMAATCSGKTDCDTAFDSCTCRDISNNSVTRTFNRGHSKLVASSTCVTIDSRNATAGLGQRSAVTLHLVDDKGHPFRGASVDFAMGGGSGTVPKWHNPLTDAELSTQRVQTTDGTIKEGPRIGDYYAILAGPPSGTASSGVNITATVNSGTCLVNKQFTMQIRSAAARASTSGTGFGGCNLLSSKGEKGYLRVKVLREDPATPGATVPAVSAYVMVGYAQKDTMFYADAAAIAPRGIVRFLDTARPPGNASNVQKVAAADGVVEFKDFGDNLNGPYIVTAGIEDVADPAHSGERIMYSLVTLDRIAHSDVQIVLPIARRSYAGSTTRWINQQVLNPAPPSTTNTYGVSLVSQKRDLGYFAGLDPKELFDTNICARNNRLAPENAYLAAASPPPPDEELWDKTFNARPHDNLQTSYVMVPAGAAFPSGRFDAWGYLLNTTYQRLGFRLNADLTVGQDGGYPLQLGTAPDPGSLVMSVSNLGALLDVVGMTLTDYVYVAGNPNLGRGAGDMFMQAHTVGAYSTSGGVPTSVTVPFFNLDDPLLDYPSASISNETTWNIAAVTGLYHMNPACGQSGQDSRCVSVPPAMRTGRTTVLRRNYQVSSTSPCIEPFERAQQQPVSRTMADFPKILDLEYEKTAKGEWYQSCPGGVYEAEGGYCRCWYGDISGSACNAPERPGDFTVHTISVKRSTYDDLSACSSTRYPRVERFPFWIIYSPGAASRVSLPDLPDTLVRSCTISSTDPEYCDTDRDRRPGLPQRLGSGRKCTTGCRSDESCESLNGISTCVHRNNTSWIIDDYEWRADANAVRLIDDACQSNSPCSETTRPVSTPNAPWASFDQPFDFAQTKACLSARSSNELIVN